MVRKVEPDTVEGVDGWTERKVLDALIRRYTAVARGNGPRYVVAEHVRDEAGFDATRTCDFMALSLWPSDQHLLQGFEVKVSRSDWLRELSEPGKAETFMRLVDKWWLVCPQGVATKPELPPGWGMVLVGYDGFHRVRNAPLLSRPRSVSRGLMVTFARAAVRTATRAVERDEQLALLA